MICAQDGHFTHRPSGTRLSLFADSMGLRTFLNHAITGGYPTRTGEPVNSANRGEPIARDLNAREPREPSTVDAILPACCSGTSRSKVRPAWERPSWPSGSAPGSTRPWCSTSERIPSSTSSTRGAPAPPFRRSCSSRWPATGSRAACGSRICSASCSSPTTCSTATRSTPTSTSTTTSCSSISGSTTSSPPTCRRPIWSSTSRPRSRSCAAGCASARRPIPARPLPAPDYIRELNEAYNHFFFHYTASPLLTVETSHVDLTWNDETVADIERQIRSMGKGTRYYVPRTQ